MTKEDKNKAFGEFLGKMNSKISLIQPNRDTYIETKRIVCEWDCSQKKFLFIFKNSPPAIWKARRKKMTKIGKNKVFQKFEQHLLMFLLQLLILSF
jgi:hypothetical protein